MSCADFCYLASNTSVQPTFFALVLWRIGNSNNMALVVKLKQRKFWVSQAMLFIIGSIWYGTNLILRKGEPPEMPHPLGEPGLVVKERSLPHETRESVVFGIPFNVVQRMFITRLLVPDDHQEISQASPIREFT